MNRFDRYIWNGVNNGEILPHGDYTAQALHIKELAALGVTVITQT